MLPLHEDTIFLLAVVAVGACMAVFTTLQARIGFWRIAALLALGLLWPWPIAAYLGLNGYTLSVASYLSIWTTAALLAGLIWGLIARRAVPITVVMISVALAPWFAGSSYLLERQRVPNADCAAIIEVRIANLMLTVPRDLGIRSVTSDGAPEQAWEGSYSDWPGAKPDVRALCHATDGGQVSIEVSHIWLSYRWFKRKLEDTCQSEGDSLTRSSTCEALIRTTPTVVQFYARPDGRPSPSLGHFNTDLIAQARSEGELSGHRCNDSTTGPGTRYCTVWYQLSSELLVVSSVKLGPLQQGEDPLADTVILIAALIENLDPAWRACCFELDTL